MPLTVLVETAAEVRIIRTEFVELPVFDHPTWILWPSQPGQRWRRLELVPTNALPKRQSDTRLLRPEARLPEEPRLFYGGRIAKGPNGPLLNHSQAQPGWVPSCCSTTAHLKIPKHRIGAFLN
jgi:hypothetical protein